MPTLAAPRYVSIARAKEVQIGWSQSHVVRVLGQPTSKQGNFWRWRSKNGSYSVTFRAGKVVGHGVRG